MLEAIFTGISLAMDALAASVATGAAERERFIPPRMAAVAGAFGAFQFMMPVAGWTGAGWAADLVGVYGSVVAAVLLFLVSGKMLLDVRRGGGGEPSPAMRLNWRSLLVMSLATSIDALVVGAGYACRGSRNILPDAAVIGIVTFFISLAGCIAGRRLGTVIGGHRCELFGGLVLAAIGGKILFFG